MTNKNSHKANRRKQSKHKDTNSFHAGILAQISDAVIAVDNDMRITFMNAAAEKRYESSASEAAGLRLDELYTYKWIRPGDESAAYAALGETGFWRGENIHVTRSGREIPVESTVATLRDSQGNILGLLATIRDIPDRKDVKQALRESEERNREIVETAREGIAIHDPDGTITYINQRMADMMGYSRDEMTGRSSLDFVGAEERGPVRLAQDSLKEQDSFSRERKLRRKDGSTLWTISSISSRRDNNGNYLGYLAMHTDITERKKTEEILKEKEEELQMIADMTPVVLNRCSGDLRYVFVNQACCNLFNRTREEIIGKKIIDIIGRPALEAILPYIGKVLQGETVIYESEIPYKDAGSRFMHVTYTPERNRQNEVVGWFASIVDITNHKIAEEALRASRERYKTLFDSMDEGFCVIEVIFNPDGKPVDYRFLEANPAFTEHTGLHNAEGKLMRSLAPEHEEHWFEIYGRIAMTGKPERFENEAKALGRYYDVYAFRVGDPGSRKVAILFNDISPRKKAEEELLRLNETLEQRVSERTALAEFRAKQLQALSVELIAAEENERRRISYIIHEDLQQILAGARMQVDVASRSKVPEPILANIGRLLDESISKSRKLSHDLSPAMIHYSGLASVLEWLAKQVKDQFDLDVELIIDSVPEKESIPLKVFVFRALQELLFNIIKHSGVNACSISLSGSGDRLSITVSDNGKGFDSKTLDFMPVHKGLGLLSLRERVSYIGGSIKIESGPGRGTSILLTIPWDLGAADEKEG